MNLFKSKRGRLSIACVCFLAILTMVFSDYRGDRSGLEEPRPSEEIYTNTDPDGDGFRPFGPPRVAGEVYIDLADDLSESELRTLTGEWGVSLRFSSEPGKQHNTVIASVAEEEMPALLSILESDPRVESADPNYLFTLTGLPVASDGFPNDPRYAEQWHMKMIEAQQAWPLSIGSDVVTAVIDTGVAYKNFDDFHQVEDLDNTNFVTGYDFVNKRVEALDDQSHGTHVAGTIAQSTNNGKGVVGVAFGTTIMPVKVLSRSGSGTLADVADGIRFSADHGATVINMSLGGPFPSASLEDAVTYANRKGTIVVCAAGNSNTPRREYPAGFDKAVSVSSVGMEGKRAFYSNHGDSISFAAPGGDTKNYGPTGGVLQNTIAPRNHKQSDYYFYQGTSMAAPHAAGVAALVASTGVTNPDAIERVIQKSASKVDAPVEEGYGAGILNAKDAVYLSGVTYKTMSLGLGLLICLVAGVSMLRRKALHHFVLMLPPAVLASSGFFFLPVFFPGETAWCNMWTLGLPSWGIPILGAAHHGNPLFLSCLLPMLLSIVVVEKPVLRALVGGLAAGFAAHLLFAAVMSTVSVLYVPVLLGRLWLVANGLLCVFLAIVLAEEHP
ncbi:MAG: S8 family serine peptidase [Vulcanimicrobiota bacterium]